MTVLGCYQKCPDRMDSIDEVFLWRAIVHKYLLLKNYFSLFLFVGGLSKSLLMFLSFSNYSRISCINLDIGCLCIFVSFMHFPIIFAQ